MEQLVQDSKSFLGKVVVPEDEFYIQITKLKKALPKDIAKATEVTQKSERVLSGAQTEASRLVTDAQAEANRLMTEAQSETKRMADEIRAEAERVRQESRERADRIVEDARREAERIVSDAQQHAEQLIAEDTIMQRAQQAAQLLHEQSVQEANEMKQHADAYAYEVLDRAGQVLSKLVMGVEAGKDHLRQIQ